MHIPAEVDSHTNFVPDHMDSQQVPQFQTAWTEQSERYNWVEVLDSDYRGQAETVDTECSGLVDYTEYSDLVDCMDFQWAEIQLEARTVLVLDVEVVDLDAIHRKIHLDCAVYCPTGFQSVEILEEERTALDVEVVDQDATHLEVQDVHLDSLDSHDFLGYCILDFPVLDHGICRYRERTTKHH